MRVTVKKRREGEWGCLHAYAARASLRACRTWGGEMLRAHTGDVVKGGRETCGLCHRRRRVGCCVPPELRGEGRSPGKTSSPPPPSLSPVIKAEEERWSLHPPTLSLPYLHGPGKIPCVRRSGVGTAHYIFYPLFLFLPRRIERGPPRTADARREISQCPCEGGSGEKGDPTILPDMQTEKTEVPAAWRDGDIYQRRHFVRTVL